MKAVVSSVVLCSVMTVASIVRAAEPTTQRTKTDPPYLAELPPAQKVVKDVNTGDDEHRTAARQAAALIVFHDLITDMAGKRADDKELTDDEQRLMDDYGAAEKKIEDTQSGPEQRAFLAMTIGLTSNPDFCDYLLKKYVSPEFRAKYQKLKAENDARQKATTEGAERNKD